MGHGAACQLHRRGSVEGMILGVNGEAFYMLHHTLNFIQCPVVEALMPELECEWCNSSGKGSLWCMERRWGATQELASAPA
jgi:hypothetical protein